MRQRPQTEGEEAQGQGQPTPSSQVLCSLKRNPAASAVNCLHRVENKCEGTQLKNLTHEM